MVRIALIVMRWAITSPISFLIACHDQPIAAGSVIDAYVTGSTVIRRMVYAELLGTLDDGTEVRACEKDAIDGTTPASISLYTVPAGRTLSLRLVQVTTRHIDLYAGKGYLVYNGLPVMAFDVMASEVGGSPGFTLPFYDLPLNQGVSLGFRIDSFSCGEETIAGACYSSETPTSDATFPSEGNVESGDVYGTAGEYTGDMVVPAESDVRLGVSFGAHGEFTGTYGGASAAPAFTGSFVPTLEPRKRYVRRVRPAFKDYPSVEIPPWPEFEFVQVPRANTVAAARAVVAALRPVSLHGQVPPGLRAVLADPRRMLEDMRADGDAALAAIVEALDRP